LVVLPVTCSFRSRRNGIIAALFSGGALSLILLSIFLPGAWLAWQANRVDLSAMYRYAQWLDNHNSRLAQILLWAPDGDTARSLHWLQKAADQDFVPAIYVVGVRFKNGCGVPRPENWTGPGGNVFAQPEIGQPLIDKAIRMGYVPRYDDENAFLSHDYTAGSPPSTN
jgi:TPR repeat protein